MKRIGWIFGLVLIVLAGTSARQDTFFFMLVSDSHYGKSDRQKNLETIARMNTMEGTDLPGWLTGKVGRPLGVIHCGDILDSPSDSAWRLFEEDYGLTGEAKLKFPVYETFGNHDGGLEKVVRQAMIRRNPDLPLKERSPVISWWSGTAKESLPSGRFNLN